MPSPPPPPPLPGSPIGRALPRREDRRLLLGRGRFHDDLELPGDTLHAVFLRSPHAHARIGAIDSTAARALPGVIAVLTGAEINALIAPLKIAPPIPGHLPVETPAMPAETARLVGDPVALVLAERRSIAEDAAELLTIAWEALPAIASVAQASAPGAALVDPTVPGNRVARQRVATPGLDAAFARAERILEIPFAQQRQTHAPIEPRGCLAIWDVGREHLTLHVGTQAPHPYRTVLAARLGLREWQATVIAPDMGGGFGQKIIPAREDLCCAAAARLLGRPVRWREGRSENLAASLHAREESIAARVGFGGDGRLVALDVTITVDSGGWCLFPADYIARMICIIIPGATRLREYGYTTEIWLTNKCPSGPMRAPMAMAAWVTEGILDEVARALGLDPLEVRRRNMIAQTDLPWISAAGQRYEAITPRATLDAVAEAIGYDAIRAQQRAGGTAGKLLGLGLCTVIESNTYGSAFYRAAGIPGSGHEAVAVRVEPSGAVLASCGLMGSGQGYETTLAQTTAAGLGCRPDDVLVQLGHTDIAPYGMGSRGARGATAGGGGLYIAGLRLQAKMLQIAAVLLGRNSADGLVLREGRVLAATGGGFTDAGIGIPEIARTAHLDPLRLPAGMMPGLHEIYAYDPPDLTFTDSAHAALVEIDPESGAIALLRYVAAENAGQAINPIIVEGQGHGAISLGLSGALMEHLAYDEDGQLLAGSFMDYALARAGDIPPLQLMHMNIPDPRTPAGIKGMSEGGTMGAAGALMNAVNDALAQRGVRLDKPPATPARIWAALQGGAGLRRT
jgi:carbon-monoxide dehydrogenase large subunit